MWFWFAFLCGLIILNIFYTCWPSVSLLLPIYKSDFCCCCWIVWVLYRCWILDPFQIYNLQVFFSHSVGCFFMCSFAMYKLLHSMIAPAPFVCICFCCSVHLFSLKFFDYLYHHCLEMQMPISSSLNSSSGVLYYSFVWNMFFHHLILPSLLFLFLCIWHFAYVS